MSRVALIILALAFSGCGSSEAPPLGSLPSSLKMSVVTVQDGQDGSMQETEETLRVGQVPPDGQSEAGAIWSLEKLFGERVSHPGASLELSLGTGLHTKVIHYDPARRTWSGSSNYLFVSRDGSVSIEPARPGSERTFELLHPHQAQVQVTPTSVTLRVDESRSAAHRRFGIRNLTVRQGDAVFTTLTEDDLALSFQHQFLGRHDAWDLRGISDGWGQLTGVEAVDGSLLAVEPEVWRDADRVPVLHVEDGELAFSLAGPEGAVSGASAAVRSVAALHFKSRSKSAMAE